MSDPKQILAPVESMERQRADLYAKLTEFKEKIEALSTALAENIAAGDDLEFEQADEVRRRRGQYRERIEDLERALAILEPQIEEQRETLVQQGFRDRMAEIEVRAGELAAEMPARLEALEALRQQVAEAEAGLARSRRLNGLLRAEGGVLADLTRLPEPEIDPRWADQGLPPADRIKPPVVRLRRITPALEGLGEGSPSLVLLEALGGGPEGDEWERTRADQNRARIEAQAQEQEEARRRVDEWLRRVLADGPAVRDRIYQRAKNEGIATMNHHAQADLSAARKRIEVVILQRRPGENAQPDPRSWWGLPGGFDERCYAESK